MDKKSYGSWALPFFLMRSIYLGSFKLLTPILFEYAPDKN